MSTHRFVWGMRPLAYKELAEHWRTWLLLLVAWSALVIVRVAYVYLGRGEQGPIEALRALVVFQALFVGGVLGHTLVTREYTGRTQLFLEALPLSRLQVLSVKLALGAAVQALLLGIAWGVCVILAWGRIALDPHTAGLLLARSAAVVAWAHAAWWALSFLGRYRVAFFILAAIVLSAVDDATRLDLGRFGPFELLGERFLSDREWPWSALSQSAIASVVLLLVGFGLGLSREGSVAALLAEQMSQREKGFAALVIVSALLAIIVLDERREKPPADLTSAFTLERDGVRVQVGLDADVSEAEARPLGERVHGELTELRNYLAVPYLPPVRLSPRRDLDAGRYERVLPMKTGAVGARLRYPDPSWDEDDFVAWLVREVVFEHTRGRARLEPARWLLDGFGWYWVHRERPGNALERDSRLALRALSGLSTVDDALLGSWLTFRERAGDPVAAAVAWSGLATLADRSSAAAVQALLQERFGSVPPPDARATWSDWRRPLPRTVERVTGLPWAQVLHHWSGALETARAGHAEALAALPRPLLQIRIERPSDEHRRLRYSLDVRPASGIRRARLLYVRLPLFDREIDEREIRFEEHDLPVAEATLAETFPRGQRLAVAAEIESTELGCPLLSGWQRLELN